MPSGGVGGIGSLGGKGVAFSKSPELPHKAKFTQGKKTKRGDKADRGYIRKKEISAFHWKGWVGIQGRDPVDLPILILKGFGPTLTSKGRY